MNASPLFLICFLLVSCAKLPAQKNTLNGSFWSNDLDPEVAELQPRGLCAYKTNGQIFVSASALGKLVFSKTGLAPIHIEGKWYYVRRDGSAIPTITFDNGPDEFIEGLARYSDGDKIGFIDETGRVAIKANYEHATSFRKGYALVCNGAKKVRKGEHTFMECGLWGCLDQNGRLIYPVKYSKSEIDQLLTQLHKKDDQSIVPAN